MPSLGGDGAGAGGSALRAGGALAAGAVVVDVEDEPVELGAGLAAVAPPPPQAASVTAASGAAAPPNSRVRVLRLFIVVLLCWVICTHKSGSVSRGSTV